MKEIEGVVGRADWTAGGRVVGGPEVYIPEEEDEVDGGGWSGGEFVLGGVGPGGEEMGRRELMARAAEERARREKAGREGADARQKERGGS
jgi:hypothetical protein